MTRHTVGTAAIDIECPRCGAARDQPCVGPRTCQPRINAAGAKTRQANALAKMIEPFRKDTQAEIERRVAELEQQLAHAEAQREAWASIARRVMAIAHGMTEEQADSFTVAPIELFGPATPKDIRDAVMLWWRRMLASNPDCPYCGSFSRD